MNDSLPFSHDPSWYETRFRLAWDNLRGINEFIRFADDKARSLLTIATVFMSGFLASAFPVVTLARSWAWPAGPILFHLSLIGMAPVAALFLTEMMLAMHHLLMVIRPRIVGTAADGPTSPLFFSSAAMMGSQRVAEFWQEFEPRAGIDLIAHETVTNACIAQDKFRHIAAASRFISISVYTAFVYIGLLAIAIALGAGH